MTFDFCPTYLPCCNLAAIFIAVMGQVLRITFNREDHTFRILHTGPLHTAGAEISVEVNGRVLTLIREGLSWTTREPADEATRGLAEAIGKALVLRYRI
jgi:hypothetical protein